MVDEAFTTTLAHLGYSMNLFIIPITTLLVGIKLFREKKASGKFNIVRSTIFSIFFTFSILVILEFLVNVPVEKPTILVEWFGGLFESLNLYSFLIGVISSLGITLIAVANRWESFYFTSLFFYGGMVILFLFTGFDDLLMIYVYITGGASIIFLYLTAFRVRDNGALALAIFFTIAFGSVAIDIALVTRISVLVYDVILIIYSTGFFKPFKVEVAS
ncbi:MAG: hypothetical protein EU542_03425 [Promethearchaeota archaeon]|nr:MAG: hypothetical protein EU542_03425 [Candidatus Lokiarchaeota archaeon]